MSESFTMDVLQRLRVRNTPYGALELMDKAADEIERLRALVLLGDFSSLRPNSDSFKLVQQIRREQSAGEQGVNDGK